MKTLRETLFELRKSRGFTQAELALKAGVSLATWHNFESGNGNPELKTLQAVLEILGVEIELKQKPLDWNLLTDLGVPLLSDEKKVMIRPESSLLIHTLNQISSQLMNIQKNSREETALVSFLIAIKDHYSKCWSKLNSELQEWVKNNSNLASIKLRRISLAKLALYL